MKNLIWLLVMAVAVFSTTPAYSAGKAENQRQSELVESLDDGRLARAKDTPIVIINRTHKKKAGNASRSRIYVAEMILKNNLPPEALDRLRDRK